MKKITIKDIAMEAGVSTATVSYVLNNKTNKVSEEISYKIKEIIKKYNFFPDQNAKSLVTKKTNLIGVIYIPLENEEKIFFTGNGFYSDFISGVELEASLLNYDVTLSCLRDEKKYIDSIIKRNYSGIIILGNQNEKILQQIDSLGIKTVIFGNHKKFNNFRYLNIDNVKGGFLATEYLIKSGHRKIGFLYSDIDNFGVFFDRFKGYKNALEKYNIIYNDKYIFNEEVSYEGGLRTSVKYLQEFKEITSIFVTADIMAIGLIKGLINNNIQVPNHISVIGFDNITTSAYYNPALTTISQDLLNVGRESVKIIVNDNGDYNIDLKVIERESCKKY
ncbi:MAG: hypothetical protein A2086_02425 [Spirochaetes bacterium GWD1_27_9]|nr:MAG: hypothetical protein A2Z98_08290 [Spirochaetes bacterium GWB1_27_13]OHD27769.1 MAG: hypothetical protein A2Y34_09020 [Spirochaetes bacterium GWC1_27_15]OHD31586.1 MAG: hypothetical protein A2086_02425 [Spirochaetes bacterium GWD1_27_9]